MNLPTAVVLIALALCVALALRAIFKKKGGHCGGCSNESCRGATPSGACPSVQRALADIDAKLDKAPGLEEDRRGEAPR